MTGKTHLISGWILGTMISAKCGLSPACVASCMVGSVFADTDHRRSMLGRFVPLWRIFRPHRRNALHSPVGLAIFGSLWSLLTMSWQHGLVFAAGYLIHLLFDWMTAMGIPWKWPEPKMFSLASVAGGVLELIILFMFYTIVFVTISAL